MENDVRCVATQSIEVVLGNFPRSWEFNDLARKLGNWTHFLGNLGTFCYPLYKSTLFLVSCRLQFEPKLHSVDNFDIAISWFYHSLHDTALFTTSHLQPVQYMQEEPDLHVWDPCVNPLNTSWNLQRENTR